MIPISTNTALLVVDVQNGFINKNTCKITSKIETYISKVDYKHRIFTRFINNDDSPFEKLLNWSSLKDSPETDIVSELKEYPTVIIDKNYYSCITDEFIKYIKKNHINTLHIVGLDTDVCVLKTAADLFEIGLKHIVLSELCMSYAGNEMHKSALKILQRFIGEKQIITNYSDFIGT